MTGPVAPPRPARRLPIRLLRDRRAVSVLEFGLALPLLAGFTLGGLEMANYILASNTTQRLATMVADMVAQSGVGGIAATETQIYDMFTAIDVSARPLQMRKNGRVIFTVLRGETQADKTVKNVFADATYAQQFDGDYVAAIPLVGCHTTTTNPVFSRVLPANELLVHAQVTYHYQPLFAASILSYFSAGPEITRTAVFRMRKNQFNISADAQHPAKSNCTTATGL
jgi:Flp pilus assembly protein TadG